MTLINSYATLAEFKAWKGTTVADATDDIIIEEILEASCRYIEGESGRVFYPRIETWSLDIPPDGSRKLNLDDDLLEVVTLTNGDDVAIASTDYNFLPANKYPKYAIKLKESSTVVWEPDGDGNTEQVIDVLAIWGYHDSYDLRAWKLGSTINEGAEFSASDVTLTVTSGTLFSTANVIKIDDEILLVSSYTGNNLTVVRGENGSTAAAHDDGTAVYIWAAVHDIRQTCLQIAVSYYQQRYGENATSESVITSGGVVITPRDVPGKAARTMRYYKKWL